MTKVGKGAKILILASVRRRAADIDALKALGVVEVFPLGTPLEKISEFIKRLFPV